MKKLKLLAQMLLLIATFSNCDDDSDDGKLTTQSKFVYQGKEYPLSNGYIALSCSTPSEDESFHAIEVYLFSSDTKFTGFCPGFYPSGTGKGLALNLSSRSASELSPGVYAEPNHSNPNVPTLGAASLYEHVNHLGTGSGTFLDKGLTGSVSVSREQSNYTITFSFTVVGPWGGETVSGKFVGVLEEY